LRGGASVRAYGLASSDAAWVWLLNPEAVWPQTPQRAVANVRVSIAGLADGTYEVEWWDPASATVLARRRADCRRGKLTLAAPEFVVDVAGKARRVE